MNPVEYLWAWLKRHAMANYCPNKLSELHATARNKLTRNRYYVNNQNCSCYRMLHKGWRPIWQI
jgi:transposase